MQVLDYLTQVDQVAVQFEQAKRRLDQAKTQFENTKQAYEEVLSQAESHGLSKAKLKRVAEERLATLMQSGLFDALVEKENLSGTGGLGSSKELGLGGGGAHANGAGSNSASGGSRTVGKKRSAKGSNTTAAMDDNKVVESVEVAQDPESSKVDSREQFKSDLEDDLEIELGSEEKTIINSAVITAAAEEMTIQ